MIKIELKKDNQAKEFVLNGLKENNREKCQWFKEYSTTTREDYNFFVYDDERLIGGAVGNVLYEWYFLDLLWLDESYRGQDIGTSLIKELEEYVQKENLIGIRLETWNFQAKEFYEKMGYKIYATIDDCPPGTINYFFMKRFN